MSASSRYRSPAGASSSVGEPDRSARSMASQSVVSPSGDGTRARGAFYYLMASLAFDRRNGQPQARASGAGECDFGGGCLANAEHGAGSRPPEPLAYRV